MATKQIKPGVEEQLRKLYDIQLIDTRIHKLEELRGELPMQVQYYEDEKMGLENRLNKLNERIDELKQDILYYKENKDKALREIERYSKMQENARNDREFKTLQEEIDFFEGEVALSDRKVKQALTEIARLEAKIGETEEELKEKNKQLEEKKAELEAILQDTEREEEALRKLKEEYAAGLPERLTRAYHRLSNKFRNRLAVTSYEESYFVIPPQVQVEIRDRDRIIVDEHTGRILVDPQLAAEEKEKMQEIFQNISNELI